MIKTSQIYHGLSGSKEAVMNLVKFGLAISDNYVILYKDEWSQLTIPAYERCLWDIAVHSSIDYNDGWKETVFPSLLPGKNTK